MVVVRRDRVGKAPLERHRVRNHARKAHLARTVGSTPLVGNTPGRIPPVDKVKAAEKSGHRPASRRAIHLMTEARPAWLQAYRRRIRAREELRPR